MTNAPNFLDAFRAATSEDAFKTVELPSGVWDMEIISADYKEVSREFARGDVTYPQGFTYIGITLKPKDPVTVDSDDLEECSDWAEKLVNLDVMTDADMKRVFVPLMEHAGQPIGQFVSATGTDLDGALKALLKKRVRVTTARTYSEKTQRSYVNVRKTAPIE